VVRRSIQGKASGLSVLILRLASTFTFRNIAKERCLTVVTLIVQVFLFANSKCKRYFHNRLKPAKLSWTAMYRKQHKKVLYITRSTFLSAPLIHFSGWLNDVKHHEVVCLLNHAITPALNSLSAYQPVFMDGI
jgi:ribosomal protein L24E